MFTGREDELKLLKARYRSKKSELVVIYGRRRIGKTALIQEFLKNKKNKYSFEGLENKSTKEQISNFVEDLKLQTKDSFISSDSSALQNWKDVFEYISQKVTNSKEKTIIYMDEFQWLAAKRSSLVSLLKVYWDKHWKNQNVMLILCGSIASYMVNQVIKSKALYGRINLEILLKGLKPNESAKLFKKKRSKEEILKYLMLFGGVPKYLEEIDLNSSFAKNMNRLCFSPEGYMLNECNRIFYNQFKETQNYIVIAKLLQNKALTSKEIGEKVNLASGGSLKRYLDNLENSEIINSYISFDMSFNTKYKKFRLSDEFLIFYYKFMEAHIKQIDKGTSKKLFENLCEDKWKPWLGFAFERFCYKNSGYLAERLGFNDEVILSSPYYAKTDDKFQIDLLYKRADKVITVCEMKYHDKEIGVDIIPAMKRKLELIKVPRGYSVETVLISNYGADKSLKTTEFFNQELVLDDLI